MGANQAERCNSLGGEQRRNFGYVLCLLLDTSTLYNMNLAMAAEHGVFIQTESCE